MFGAVAPRALPRWKILVDLFQIRIRLEAVGERSDVIEPDDALTWTGAPFRYISCKDELTMETDEGERIASREAQRALAQDWHLELTSGQYRAPRDGRTTARSSKFVHVVLSMPSPTPPGKVLAASRKFAREIRRAAPMRHGPAYRSAAPACSPGREGRQRRGAATAH